MSAFVGIKLCYLFIAWLAGVPGVSALGVAVGHVLPLGGL